MIMLIRLIILVWLNITVLITDSKHISHKYFENLFCLGYEHLIGFTISLVSKGLRTC